MAHQRTLRRSVHLPVHQSQRSSSLLVVPFAPLLGLGIIDSMRADNDISKRGCNWRTCRF
jgi:hypothetical protein